MPDYERVFRLGAGAFGEVWLVNDRALGVERAVKFVQPGRISHATNFYEEPQTLRELRHTNIVAVEDAGRETDGSLYIAMEYLPSGSIQDLAKGGILPIRQAVRLVIETCRGLEYVHNAGFIHRDIKPANVLIGTSGEAKLSDFGLAARMDARGQASPVGYVTHLAPEVIEGGETSRLSDVYALGVTLYRLVNGDAFLPAFPDVAELERAIVAGKYPPRTVHREFVPARLKRAMTKAMNLDPAKRFASAAEFRHALEQVSLCCDWEVHAISNGRRWTASTQNNDFEATLTRSGTGEFAFSLRQGRVGGTKRESRLDGLVTGSAPLMQTHVTSLLSRITEFGR